MGSVMLTLGVAVLLGFLSGIGIGGGSLLMLYLLQFTELELSQARMLNLLFFLPCAISASFLRIKQKTLPWKRLLPAMASGIAAAVLTSYLGKALPEDWLRKGFGVLLIVTAIRELRYKKNTQP